MKDRMVILGNTRIRLSNIKNYGISTGKKYKQKIYNREEEINPISVFTTLISFFDNNDSNIETRYVYRWSEEWNHGMSKETIDELDGALLYWKSDGSIGATRSVLASSNDIVEYKEKYLYITTFQNDNFVFWESEVSFDIQKKCKEIDCMFGGDCTIDLESDDLKSIEDKSEIKELQSDNKDNIIDDCTESVLKPQHATCEVLDKVTDNWEQIIKKFRGSNHISDVSYNTWIKPLNIIKVENGVVFISVPLNAQKDFIGKKYLQPLKECIAQVTGYEYDVKLIVDENDIEEIQSNNDNYITDDSEKSVLNPQYTFETFVVGKNNNFAHAASIAVAETPCEIYNPLFLYGENGSGKTHLMQSIADYIIRNHADKKVLYVCGKTFASDFAEVTMETFHNKYRNIDVLLVDDIQPIIKDETLQEEFFHLFNYLHSRGKHIVLSSDKPPKDMKELQDRLRVCFEWGILADISLPDLETEQAIRCRQKELQ